MPEPIRLRYLHAAFEMVGERPVVTPESVAAVDAWESARGIRLPAAVREWHTIANGREVLERFSNCDHPSSLGEVERAYRVLDETVQDGPPGSEVIVGVGVEEWEETEILATLAAPTFLKFMIENQGVVSWHVPVVDADGRAAPDDPPVYVDNDTSALAEWSVVGPSLSVFLFDWFCENRYRTLWGPHPDQFAAGAEASLPTDAELARLRGHFAEGPHTPGAGDAELGWVYRFYATDGCLRIGWADFEINPGRVPYWELRAATGAALERMLRAVWPLSNVADTARPIFLEDERVEGLLGSLGWVKDKGVRDATWHLRHGMALRRQGTALDDEGLLRRAVAELTRAIELDPTRALAYRERAYAHERLGDVAATLPDYARLTELVGRDWARHYHLKRADAHLQLGRPDAAVDDVRAAVRVDPDYTDYATRADAFAAAGRTDLARRVYECWRDHPPKNPTYREHIAAYFVDEKGDE